MLLVLFPKLTYVEFDTRNADAVKADGQTAVDRRAFVCLLDEAAATADRGIRASQLLQSGARQRRQSHKQGNSQKRETEDWGATSSSSA